MCRKNEGFTLIEMIMVIVVLGILAVGAGLGIVEISRGFVFSQANAVTVQKGQIAMARLVKELGSASSITSGTGTSITFVRNGSRTISWAGGANPLVMSGDTLVNSVSNFEIRYYTNLSSYSSTYSSNTLTVEVRLSLTGAENTVSQFSARIAL